jgi:hypothetical protein
MALSPHIHFVMDPRATRWAAIERLDARVIDEQPQRFSGGRNSWIAQSFLRLRPALRERGWKVTAGPISVPGTITVVHRDDMNRFASAAHRSFLVVVRADRSAVSACDLAITQNAVALSPHERFIPLWPQPGLVRREARRGNRIERVAYQGRTSSAPRWFHDGAFLRGLERRGVRLEIREAGWQHYEDVDVVLAARDEVRDILATKPATKIYNGWLSRAPVVASPEPAYRELWRSVLDFIEVVDAPGVIRAIDALRSNSRLYAAMVANGVARSAEFDVPAIESKWLALFDEEIVPAFIAKRGALSSRRTWFLGAMGRQKVASRVSRARIACQRLARHAAAGFHNGSTFAHHPLVVPDIDDARNECATPP